MANYHLVVLVHGLWGNSSHMQYIQNQIEQQIEPIDPNGQLVVYKTGSHSGFLTYDGIDINGKRISDEIWIETERLNNEKDKVTKFSIVGYSLGGLISRYAIGILYSHKYFESIEPINFITFCSPHVGVLNPGASISVKLFNKVVPYFLAHSGEQLFLRDKKYVKNNENQDNLPLLVWMTDSNSFFFKALANFKYRSLYSNIINDKRTSWFTSGISVEDPFDSIHNENPKVYELDYIKGYEPTVIDYSKPILYKKVTNEPEETTFENSSQLSNFLARKLNWLKVLGNLILFTPLWAIYFISTSLLERIKLNRRVNAFFCDASNNLLHLYDIINDDINGCANDVIQLPENGSSVDLQSSKHMPIDKSQLDIDESFFDTIERDLTNQVNDQTDNLVESVYDAMNSETYNDYHYNITNENMEVEEVRSDFKLNLSKNQFNIISQLNSLSWNKYPILIRNTKATHACAIVRNFDINFEEGKTVINHFVKEVFKSD